MTGSSIQQEAALQVLRYFNAAASTSRLYPQTAPQVEKSVEKAYQEIKLYVRKHGEMSFGYENDKSMLCFQSLFPETPERIKEFHVFHHLKLIGLANVLFEQSLSRSDFMRILQVFTTSVEKIKKTGGGVLFARSLDVTNFFPDKLQIPKHIQAELEKKRERQKTAVIEMPQQYLLFLFGKREDPRVAQALEKLFRVPEKALAITVSTIAHLLKGLQKEKCLVVSPLFPHVISNLDRLITADHKHDVAIDTASFLVKGLKEPALCVLLSQKFPAVFGEDLYFTLVHLIKKDAFERIVERFRKHIEQLNGSSTINEGRHQLLVDSYKRLMATDRGKQYLASERIVSKINGSELQRQKTRVQTGLEALLRGDVKLLQSSEFLATLPANLERFIADGREEKIAFIIGQLSDAFRDSEGVARKRLIQGVSFITEKLIELEKWNDADKLIPPLLEWLQQSDELDDTLQRCAKCLQALAINGWSRDANRGADRVAEVFFKIRTGSLDKPQEIVDLIGMTQDEGFDRLLLMNQLSVYLQDPEEIQAGMRLIHQGLAAGRVLVQFLLDSDRTDDRLNLLELLTELDVLLPQLVLEYLRDPMPWYKKRNLIKLLSEAGGERHVEPVSFFLNHDDPRVQREALTCIYKISGSNKKKHLLFILPKINVAMKSQVVKALIPFADEEVAIELVPLLADRQSFPDTIANELLGNICEALSHSLSVQAVESLQRLVGEKGTRKGHHIKDSVYRVAAKAIRRIESRQQEIQEQRKRVKQLRKNAVRKAAMIKMSAGKVDK